MFGFLKKQKLVLVFENVGNALNICNQKYDTFLLCGNFNSEHSEPSLSVSYGKYLL